MKRKISNQERLNLELSVIKKLITDALTLGYAVRIFDGEEWTTNGPTTNEHQLLKDLRSTDQDTIAFYHKEGGSLWKKFGFVTAVYGNMPYEVIADSSTDELTAALLKGAESIQEQLERDLT